MAGRHKWFFLGDGKFSNTKAMLTALHHVVLIDVDNVYLQGPTAE